MPHNCNCEFCTRAGSGRTLISVVIDESGSMESCRDATILGFNSYIRDLRQLSDAFVTITKFGGSRVTQVANGWRASSVEELTRATYQPGGGTPLFDAVSSAVLHLDAALSSRDKGIVVILTDGEENASVGEYRTLASIKELIARCEARGNWTFVLLGADSIDAWALGTGMGIRRGNIMAYSHDAPQAAFMTTSMSTQAFAASGARTTEDFFEGSAAGDADAAPPPIS